MRNEILIYLKACFHFSCYNHLERLMTKEFLAMEKQFTDIQTHPEKSTLCVNDYHYNMLLKRSQYSRGQWKVKRKTKLHYRQNNDLNLPLIYSVT